MNKEQQRIETILEILLQYTQKEFSEKIPISEAGDELDAIALGINTIGEELGLKLLEIEKTNQQIEETRDFLETILENIPNMILVKDAKELRFVSFNKAGEKLLGYSRQELLGKNDYDFFPKKEADFFIAKDREVLNSGKMLDIPEEPIQTRHKSRRWLHTKKIPIFDKKGRPVFLLGISEDITEQREVEHAIKEKDERFRSLINSSSDGIITANQEGHIISWNKGAEEIFGHTEEEALNQLLSIIMPERYHRKHTEGLNRYLRTKVPHVIGKKIEMEGIRKDGSEFPVELSLGTWQSGNKDYFIGILRDITERKNAEEKIKEFNRNLEVKNQELQSQQEELQQFNEELEEQTQKLKEQQDELQAVNEELEEQAQVVEQKNRDLETARTDIELKARQLEVTSKYKSEFLANMSHELRTPLNSLLILSNDLLRNKGGNLTEEQVESAQIISRGGNDLLILINEILDLSKIEAGRMDLNIKEVNVREAAADIHRNFKRTAEEKGLLLKTTIDDALPEIIHTDRQRLEQVLKNLISNAIKFTEKGSVTIDFYRDAGDYLAIAVKDTGIGIPKDKYDVIFEAFQQVESGTSRKYGGTGLGLSISRELVRLLGGRITLESQMGEGSVFTLIIPLKAGEGTEVVPPKPKLAPKKTIVDHRKNFINYPTIEDQRNEITEEDNVILIIEDDKGFARTLAAQARDKDFKYLCAATGEDGLLLAEQYRPHAVILDLDLPGIDGSMVLKELKGNPDLRHIPVHIITVKENTLDPIRSGAVEYLTKPVTQEQLDEAFARIEDFVSRKIKNLLIVEDDEALRRSIVKLVGNSDVKCYEAGTAKEAMEHFKKQAIDCMVLDIGLPDISGFELIKELEKKYGKKVPPIIVYTGKDLTIKENEELQQYAETIIVKGVKSEERLLDETALFLHRTVKDLPKKKREIITGLYDKETLFQGKKVLLVDDDMRNIFALSKVLKEKGLEIIKAENGKVALEVLNSQPEIDLVLMDIMMPEMDGYDCMQEIRRQNQFKDLPIIALTAKAMKEDRRKCIDAGANDYIAKPIDVDRLLSLMRIWIKK